ncbi:MAG: outer membrane chaperone Skp (OmpH) [Ignavibacteria bacterium]|nr:MAG: outer membrane chaperone Skp (OmpH) [Ignavibacteria bacterium]KAF0160435.1 MAG: outer membrane chaperone Skp (OmpH) [Ignavibacteria bacterium]
MKKLVALFLIVLSFSIYAQQTQLKIGYVDSEVILAQFPEAIKAKSDLEGMVAKWRKDLDSMQTDLQKLYADYQKLAQDKNAKQDDIQKSQKNVVDKEQRAQQFQQSKFAQPNGEYFVRQEQLMKPVKEKIFKAIDEVSNSEAMQFVFDKAGDVVLLKADAQYDITFKVLDLLKRGKK